MKRFECQAILFDLDGVLVDSTAYVEQQWRRWATAKGLPPEPFLQVCHGRRALETIRLAAPHLDAEAEVAAFRPDDTGWAGLSLGPVEGAQVLLGRLPVGSWAVATSGVRLVAKERLERAGLPVPAVLVCAEDVLHGKPSPDVYLMAALSLGVAPANCLVIEDAPAGIEAARSAGMKVIALTTTHRIEELDADGHAASLTGIHVGRIQQDSNRPRLIELLVPEAASSRHPTA
jgi:mannitol-1-/sugar-/sorbitol-6-phosphatase